MKRTRLIVFYYKNVSVKMDAPVIRLIRDQFKVCIIKNYVKFRIWTKNILVLQYLYFLFLSNHRSRQTFRIFQDNLKNFSQRKKKRKECTDSSMEEEGRWTDGSVFRSSAKRRPSNIKFHAERESRTLHAVTRCKVIFVFGESVDILSPSLGKVEGRGGSVPGEDKGGGGDVRVRCTARSASRGIMLPYLPITKPLLRWVPPSMNRTDTLDMPWHGHRLRRLHSQPPRERARAWNTRHLFIQGSPPRSCLSFSRGVHSWYSARYIGRNIGILCRWEYLEFDDTIPSGGICKVGSFKCLWWDFETHLEKHLEWIEYRFRRVWNIRLLESLNVCNSI